MNSEQSPPRILAIREVLAESLALVLTVRSPALVLLFFAVILPELVFTLIFAEYGISQVQTLLQVFTIIGQGTSNISAMVQPLTDFVGYYSGVSLILWFTSLTCYFSIILMCCQARRGVPVEPLMITSKQGGIIALKRGLCLLLLMVFLSATMRVIPAAAIFVGTLALMTPVLIVVEKTGVWSSFWRSVKVGYSVGTQYRGWPTIVSLLAIGAGFYSLLLGLFYLSEFLFELHYWFPLPATGPLHTLGTKPYGLLFFTSIFLELLAATCVTLFLPAITVTIYGKVTDRQISVEA